jgi:hypothetical protein
MGIGPQSNTLDWVLSFKLPCKTESLAFVQQHALWDSADHFNLGHASIVNLKGGFKQADFGKKWFIVQDACKDNM